MKKVASIIMVVLILCLSGCNLERTYGFMQPHEAVVSIDLIYVDPFSDPITYNDIEATHTIPPERWDAFFDEFSKVTCMHHGMDPTYSISGTVIRITYADGGHEVISAYTGLHISATGKRDYTRFTFNKSEFNALLARIKTDLG